MNFYDKDESWRDVRFLKLEMSGDIAADRAEIERFWTYLRIRPMLYGVFYEDKNEVFSFEDSHATQVQELILAKAGTGEALTFGVSEVKDAQEGILLVVRGIYPPGVVVDDLLSGWEAVRTV